MPVALQASPRRAEKNAPPAARLARLARVARQGAPSSEPRALRRRGGGQPPTALRAGRLRRGFGVGLRALFPENGGEKKKKKKKRSPLSVFNGKPLFLGASQNANCLYLTQPFGISRETKRLKGNQAFWGAMLRKTDLGRRAPRNGYQFLGVGCCGSGDLCPLTTLEGVHDNGVAQSLFKGIVSRGFSCTQLLAWF